MTVPVLQGGAVSSVELLSLLVLVVLLVGVVVTAMWIYVTYWTYKDATRRGMDNPSLWTLLVVVTGVVGFVVYILVREDAA